MRHDPDYVLPDCDLEGAKVLVTRTVHQAALLCRLINRHNGRPFRLPAIEIIAPAKPEIVRSILSSIDTYDIAIFVSANAVIRGLPYLPDGRLPDGLQIAAVGRATAQALADAGCRVAIVPHNEFNSEALLETPQLNRVADKRIVVFRGDNGRPLLGDTLVKRGATVEYAEVYRRRCPQLDISPEAVPWLTDLDVVTATSNAILANLFELFGADGSQQLQQTPLVVISRRIREHARSMGCRQIILADGPDDYSILEAICDWSRHR